MTLPLQYPGNTELLRVTNRKTRKWCEMCQMVSKSTIKTSERPRSGVFIVNFEHITHLLFLLLTLCK